MHLIVRNQTIRQSESFKLNLMVLTNSFRWIIPHKLMIQISESLSSGQQSPEKIQFLFYLLILLLTSPHGRFIRWHLPKRFQFCLPANSHLHTHPIHQTPSQSNTKTIHFSGYQSLITSWSNGGLWLWWACKRNRKLLSDLACRQR